MCFLFAWMCTLFLREFRFSYIPSLFGNFFASWYHHVLFLPNNLLGGGSRGYLWGIPAGYFVTLWFQTVLRSFIFSMFMSKVEIQE